MTLVILTSSQTADLFHRGLIHLHQREVLLWRRRTSCHVLCLVVSDVSSRSLCCSSSSPSAFRLSNVNARRTAASGAPRHLSGVPHNSECLQEFRLYFRFSSNETFPAERIEFGKEPNVNLISTNTGTGPALYVTDRIWGRFILSAWSCTGTD